MATIVLAADNQQRITNSGKAASFCTTSFRFVFPAIDISSIWFAPRSRAVITVLSKRDEIKSFDILASDL